MSIVMMFFVLAKDDIGQSLEGFLISASVCRDLFILSRLNATIKECNLQLSEYSFGNVASALHSFFLYDVRPFKTLGL
jgi:valyl-tRNA synthetase